MESLRPALKRPFSARLSALAALGALALAAFSFQLAHSWESARFLQERTRRPLTPFVLEGSTRVISRVRAGAKEAGLEVGDQVVAVQGVPFDGYAVFAKALAGAKPGDRLAATVRRARPDGTTEEVTRELALAPRASLPPDAGEWATALMFALALPLFCLLVGFGVAFLRPHDPLAWLLLLLLLSFSRVPNPDLIDMSAWPSLVAGPALVWQTLLETSWGLWMMLFGIYFPERLELDRRVPWLKWLLIVPVGLTAMGSAVAAFGFAFHFPLGRAVERVFAVAGRAPMIVTMVAIGVFFASLGFKSGTTEAPDARRRLRLMAWGTQISLIPAFVLALMGVVRGRGAFSGVAPEILVPALLMSALFPVTLAYVIVVQRALDVRVVLRQGLRYAFARGTIRTAQAVAAALLIFGAVTVAADPSVNRPRRIQYLAFGVMFVFLVRRVGERLLAWTDRRFFREAYDTERILTGLSEQVRTMVETGPLVETVAKQIADSLHVTRVAAFLEKDGRYPAAHGLGFPEPLATSFAADSPTVRRLRETREPQRVYLEDPDSWAHRGNGDAGRLEALGTQLLLPFTAGNKLLGFLSQGPKQSEEPYSATDLRLLKSVASQTGLALENSRLTAAVAADVARRERANRELEIAREVQERFFPQNCPPVPGLDYAGRCRPALGVGGDYYDFLELPQGGFGLAIGDVSGKGIAAALLMASLQASLRGQTLAGATDLSALMANVNRLVYDSSPDNRYATFFYAQYDPQNRRLTYVNAGHNAPMLFRGAQGRPALRLEDGGPVIGLLDSAPFRHAALDLQPGDLLVAYTDGISEAMNPVDEEWGEERLAVAVAAAAGRDAAGIVDSLMAAADAFASGAKQHDDMTVIAVRVL